MLEFGKLFYLPAAVFVAWHIARHYEEGSRNAIRVLGAITLAIYGITVVSGLLPPEARGAIHGWSGHGLLIAEWLFLPFAAGVAIRLHAGKRPGLLLAQLFALMFVFGVSFVATITGYLRPSELDPRPEETINRFQVLHLYALPTLVGLLLVLWVWFFRPLGTPEQEPIE